VGNAKDMGGFSTVVVACVDICASCIFAVTGLMLSVIPATATTNIKLKVLETIFIYLQVSINAE
jgi:hypothetical protein